MGDAAIIDEEREREERKIQRRKRLDQNLKSSSSALVSSGSDDGQNVIDSNLVPINLDKVVESASILARKKFNAIQSVTDVRVVTDGLEAKRRDAAATKLKERIAKLEEENYSSAASNNAIQSKWSEILEYKIPQDLQNELKLQIMKCNEIIKSKDDLIEDFKAFLREKDEEYVRVLKKQTLDINELMNRIGKVCTEMQAEFDAQTEIIRETYVTEREIIVKKHSDDIDSILSKRKEKEFYYTEERTKREIKYQKEIDELIAKGTDEYNKLKIELESNIQTLNQQLEDIKATYQLNSEKLEYNFRVLTELDSEKMIEREKCRRKATKIKDQLNTIIAKYHEMDKNYSKSSSELTEDYRMLTKKYKDLQVKFKHFELADTNKYRQVWLMHQEESRELINQLVMCDQIITEQFLGITWNTPDLKFLDNFDEDHNKPSGTAVLGNSYKDPNKDNVSSDSSINVVSTTRFISFLETLISNINMADNVNVVSHFNILKEDMSENKLLVPIQSLSNVFKIEGIEESEIHDIVTFYFNLKVENLGSVTQQVLFDIESDEIGDKQNNSILKFLSKLDEASVVELIKKFRNQKPLFINNAISTENLELNETIPKKSDDTEEKLKQQKLKDAANYWDNLSNAVSDENVDVWKQLLKDYINLKAILDKRSKSLREIKSLNTQNSALKAKLNYCLGDSAVNESFQISPVLTLKIPKNNFQQRSMTSGNSKFSKTLPPISSHSNNDNKNLDPPVNSKMKTKILTYNENINFLDKKIDIRSQTINDMASLRKEFVDHIQQKSKHNRL